MLQEASSKCASFIETLELGTLLGKTCAICEEDSLHWVWDEYSATRRQVAAPSAARLFLRICPNHSYRPGRPGWLLGLLGRPGAPQAVEDQHLSAIWTTRKCRILAPQLHSRVVLVTLNTKGPHAHACRGCCKLCGGRWPRPMHFPCNSNVRLQDSKRIHCNRSPGPKHWMSCGGCTATSARDRWRCAAHSPKQSAMPAKSCISCSTTVSFSSLMWDLMAGEGC